jgi:hypothetical protein
MADDVPGTNVDERCGGLNIGGDVLTVRLKDPSFVAYLVVCWPVDYVAPVKEAWPVIE